jgi:histidine ammonia-lyase
LPPGRLGLAKKIQAAIVGKNGFKVHRKHEPTVRSKRQTTKIVPRCDTKPRMQTHTPKVPFSEPFWIGQDVLDLSAMRDVCLHGKKVAFSETAQQRIARSRAVVDKLLEGGDDARSVYGINTGFGFLADVRISAGQLVELQHNLVRSHAAGVGPGLPIPVVRGMLLLRAVTLSLGHSGVRLSVACRLCEFLNRQIHPCVPSKGSVGASGDLAPLAHLSLGLIGEGEVEVGMPGQSRRKTAAEAHHEAGLEKLSLSAKEGLALINGTQCMTAIGMLAVAEALELCAVADVVGAMSLEALLGTPRAFDARIHAVRPQPGQARSAANLRALLAGSPIVESHKDCGKVQDPYSLRCMPQVHGATRDALGYAEQVLLQETRSATDNPLIFVEETGQETGENLMYDIVSGGNFHGQPVALALDFAGIATAELANMSERRIEQLVNPHLSSGLPAFLVRESGLHSGYMIAQVTAAALVSENKILAHPASVDSIPSSAGREDHVSMGTHAADKLCRIVENVRTVLAIELCCAAQGVSLRAPLKPANALFAAHKQVRTRVAELLSDRPLYVDIEAARQLLQDGSLLTAVRQHTAIE